MEVNYYNVAIMFYLITKSEQSILIYLRVTFWNIKIINVYRGKHKYNS